MAALETIILYVQLTLGIANPTTTDIQRASATLDSSSSYTYVTSGTQSPTTCTNTAGGWDIYEND